MFNWFKNLFRGYVEVNCSSTETKRETRVKTSRNSIRVELNGKVLYDGPPDKINPEAQAVVDQTNAMKKDLVESMKDMFKDIT